MLSSQKCCRLQENKGLTDKKWNNANKKLTNQ